MLSAPHLIGIALILLCMIATTLHLSLRDVSFATLSKALAKRRRNRWLEIYREMSDEFILSVATVRMASTLGLVIVVFDMLSDSGTSLALFYAEVFIVSAMLISVFGVASGPPTTCIRDRSKTADGWVIRVGDCLSRNQYTIWSAIRNIV